ncbi:MAG: pyridoxamine 5'-phosphate oxidase family protein [Anaerolineaceae bacterium]|nr:pyridoxamine 5'-phosphate oxidase family protein [Anaerolineaceae bacterium]
MQEFQKTTRNRINRKPERGRYDAVTIYQILDEALLCYVGFIDEGQPTVIPNNHARMGNTLYLHGAKASRMLRIIQDGNPVCVTTAIVDGIVFARSVFGHSINYRSVVLFGHGRTISKNEEKLAALKAITDHVAPGRWTEARLPTQKELDATLVIAIEIESASAKVRNDPPKEDEEEDAPAVWVGVLPLTVQAGLPQPEVRLNNEIVIPEYISSYRRK